MATVTRGYHIRTYPNGAQQRLLDRWFGASCWLSNTALEIRSYGYRRAGLRLTGNDISRWLTQWKRTPGHEWLADIPATILTQCLRDQDQAFRNFFGVKKDGTQRKVRTRYPKPKKKQTRASLRFQDVHKRCWERGELSLPKLGRLKLAEALPRTTDGKLVEIPDTVTVTRDPGGRFYVSFKAEVEVAPLPCTGRTVGVDLGLKHLATLSNGVKIEAPKKYFAAQRYLRRQKRAQSRKVGANKGEKPSARYLKQKMRVGKAQVRVTNQRVNFTHNLTTWLVRQYDEIHIEDLNVKALARGMHAKSIHDAAFGEFRRQLTYKCAWYGRKLIVTGRYERSTGVCTHCGYVTEKLPLYVREWDCPQCG